MNVKNAEGKEQVWTLDLKNDGTIKTGKGSTKPDIIISLDDDTFVQLASGKLNGKKKMPNKIIHSSPRGLILFTTYSFTNLFIFFSFFFFCHRTLSGQKAFMAGKLKIKGNMMLATKLDSVFSSTRSKAKL